MDRVATGHAVLGADGVTLPRRGLVLGKFMPPHSGHLYLCDFARISCSDLTVLVCSLPDDPIPGAERLGWMRELVPEARVLWCNEIVPQAPEDDPEFWPIWRDLIARHVGPVDAVFASEAYGHRLAREVGASFIPCDPLRESVPVSATAIREQPAAHWRFVPAPVRPWFVKRVCVFGPESSGKTTLARALARAFDSVWVPEYGRTYTQNFGVDITPADLEAIRDGQLATRAAAARRSGPLLVEDTDPILTCVWSDMLLADRADWMNADLDPADLYLLTDVDIPWTDDGTRYFPDPADRQRFAALCRAELQRRDLPYVTIRGSPQERLETAIEEIGGRLGVRRLSG